MHTGVMYGWGFLGGLIAAVVVYVLPTLIQAALSGEELVVTRHRAVLIAAVLLILSAAAGVVAVIPDHVTRGQAISIGLASQTILKGLISGARDALPPPPL